MTTLSGAGTPPANYAPETAASGPLAEVVKGRTPGAAVARAARSTFAECLELLAREGRASRGGALLGPSQVPARNTSAGARGAAPASAQANEAALEPRGGAEEDANDGFSASIAVTVGREATIDPLVPLLVSMAPLAPSGAPTVSEPGTPLGARAPIEQLMAKLVRRIAWSGNARTGSAVLELGAGELEGATLTIHADDGVVRVALDLPPGVDRAAWKERISGRLGARGLQVEAIDVV